MFTKIRQRLVKHMNNNLKTYVFLLLAFIVGVSSGAFTVNGLNVVQREELQNYFQGFLQLLDNQSVDSSELLMIALVENIKLVLLLWILGVTIIGIPFIFIIVGVRGFITGFSSGFIIETLGLKGTMFVAFTLLPKEIIIVPCIIALGVSGINFSLNIIKNKSIKRISKDSLKTSFLAYCMVTVLYMTVIFSGILLEAYVTPVFVKMIAPIITN